MSKETLNNQTNKTNTEVENFDVVLPEPEPSSRILDEVKAEFAALNGDKQQIASFTKNEFKIFDQAFVRCGYIIKQLDETKLYKKFGKKGTAELLEKVFKIKAPQVSRYRIGIKYAEPLAKKLPDAELCEYQMRELHGVVGRSNPKLKGKDKVEQAVKIYEELYKKNPSPTASDIAKICPKPKPVPKPKPKPKPAPQPDESVNDTEGDVDSEEGFKSAVKEYGNVTVDDLIGSKLATELFELLAHVLDHPLIVEEIQERFEAAFEALGIEPAIADEAESEDDEGGLHE